MLKGGLPKLIERFTGQFGYSPGRRGRTPARPHASNWVNPVGNVDLPGISRPTCSVKCLSSSTNVREQPIASLIRLLQIPTAFIPQLLKKK